MQTYKVHKITDYVTFEFEIKGQEGAPTTVIFHCLNAEPKHIYTCGIVRAVVSFKGTLMSNMFTL